VSRASVAAVVLVLGGAVVATTVFGLTVGTVTSGSMEPTLTTDDAFVLIDGEPTVGEVITFRQSTADGSRLVTHRVVRETPDGYVTKGDANPTTDQAAGADPVAQADVVGVVPEFGGAPLVVPYAGLLLGWIPGLRLPLLALVLLGLGYDAVSDEPSPSRVPHVTYGTLLAAVFLLGTVGGTVGVLSVGASSEAVYQVTDSPDDQPGTVATDRLVEREVELEAARPAFSYRFVTAEGATVRSTETTGTQTTTTVAMGPFGPGPHAVDLRIDNVPRTLPRAWLAPFHRFHPVAGVLASVLPVTLPVYLFSRFLLPTQVPVSWIVNARRGHPRGGR
jgi:signal peptidase